MSEERQLVPIEQVDVTPADVLDAGLFEQALAGRAVVVVQAPLPAIMSPRERSSAWHRAFSQWIGEFSARNTQRAYQRAWDDLLEYTGKQIWAIQSDDIRDWMQDLSERPLDDKVFKGLRKKGRRDSRVGFSPATINQYLAGISSFFTFTMERYLVRDVDGRERPLHDGANPARAVRRLKARRMGQKTPYLPVDELFGLLRAIPQDSVQGLRDYALFVGYCFTGRRNSEWRTLRWGDLEISGGRAHYVWSGKGKEDQKFELAPPVWAAVQTYLQAAGRWGALEASDYIFVAINDHASRLQNVGEDYAPAVRPLSMGQINNLLKRYARRAGLDADRLHVHVLRHSAAMMLDELGFDIRYISKHLGHSSVDMTAHYLDHMRGQQDQSWRKVAAALRVDLLGGNND